MGYYSALNRKGILTCATTCMNLEDIMLSDISHKKRQILMFHFYEVPGVMKFTDRKWNGGVRERERGVSVQQGQCRFGKMMLRRWMVVVVARQRKCT